MTDLERFLQKVDKRPDGCWLWTASVDGGGYGRFYFAGQKRSAHRFAFEVIGGGMLVEGLQLDHLCRVRNCVNPDHLEQVTAQENTLRSTGFPAVNAVKTTCPAGHPLTGDNVYHHPAGRRRCRACNRALARRRRQRVAT